MSYKWPDKETSEFPPRGIECWSCGEERWTRDARIIVCCEACGAYAHDGPKPRMFPILWQGRPDYMKRLAELDCPREVPWSIIEPFEHQAKKNHSQSLETLASRGGLAPSEFIAVYFERGFSPLSAEAEVATLKEIVRHEKGPIV